MKPIIIQILGAELAGKSQSVFRELIEGYFDKIIWSLEKEEWEEMSEAQKMEFVRKAHVELNT